jgi:hypothetical protein
MDIRIDASSPNVVFALWDRVGLSVWKGPTTVQLLRRGEQFMEQHLGRRGEPLLLFTVIEDKAPLPSLEARVELAAYLKRCNGKLERSVLVFEGEGFRAASVRAVVAGVSLFSRPAYPHRVFGNVSEAARFLAGGKSGSPAPHMLIRMVHEARRHPSTNSFMPWLPIGTPQPGTFSRPRS